MKKYCIKNGYKINNKNIHYDMTKESNKNKYQIDKKIINLLFVLDIKY